MIRFVDMTDAYWGGDEINMRENPCCAFLNTVNDQFVRDDVGSQVFDSDKDIDYIEDPATRERCRGHVPEGFWTKR